MWSSLFPNLLVFSSWYVKKIFTKCGSNNPNQITVIKENFVSTSLWTFQLLSNDSGVKWREEHVETSHICTNKDIDQLITDTEATVTNELEGGDRQKAMKRLRVPPLGEQQSPWTTFKVGLFSGSFIVLLIAVVLAGNSKIFHFFC